MIVACALHVSPLVAQSPLTRADAARVALEHGARIGVVRADVAIAAAELATARAYPDPSVTAMFTRSVPTHHYALEVPLDVPMRRAPRIQAARARLRAAELRGQLGRLLIELEADTLYTRAIAARGRLALSRRTASDADSILRAVERRRGAGDASDLDAELARVNAGEHANFVTDDSLAMISALLDLQAALGIASERVEIDPVDSLTAPPTPAPAAPRPLGEIAAEQALDAAALNARLHRRSRWPQLSIAFGFEHGDPDQRGILPTFGLGIGLPLFERGSIAQADAERAKAEAELTLARVESKAALAHARRARTNAVAKAARDVIIIGGANRVAAMSIAGYRAGTVALIDVLAAQRTARELSVAYIDDLAAAWIATAELRVFSALPMSSAAMSGRATGRPPR